MDALVVIHTGTDWVYPPNKPGVECKDIGRLFDRIANEIDKFICTGKRAYYLACSNSLPQDEKAYPSIKAHFEHMRYITLIPYEKLCWKITSPQFLQTKKELLDDGIEKVILSGVRSEMCIKEVNHLLIGEPHNNNREDYYLAAKNILRLSYVECEEIINKKMDVQVPKDLINKKII